MAFRKTITPQSIIGPFWMDFIPIIFTKGINQIKEGKLQEKVNFDAYKKIVRFNTLFKIWVQSSVGAIPRLPEYVTNQKLPVIVSPLGVIQVSPSLPGQVGQEGQVEIYLT